MTTTTSSSSGPVGAEPVTIFRRIDDAPGEYDGKGHSIRDGYGRVNAANAGTLAGS